MHVRAAMHGHARPETQKGTPVRGGFLVDSKSSRSKLVEIAGDSCEVLAFGRSFERPWLYINQLDNQLDNYRSNFNNYRSKLPKYQLNYS